MDEGEQGRYDAEGKWHPAGDPWPGDVGDLDDEDDDDEEITFHYMPWGEIK